MQAMYGIGPRRAPRLMQSLYGMRPYRARRLRKYDTHTFGCRHGSTADHGADAHHGCLQAQHRVE
ncbi:hypothetical protein GCM10010358_24410 [Streptomyces minutiscleroticus]|uniref:Uncharacterized protein n=1 Tax=Streptomyces minutiscleroticus TaxID=68238 RepID=A0A918KQ96_9ACTN|nr:hypothetical protein GCM10010358_24410 [Streptomyces minutiscleroticus]